MAATKALLLHVGNKPGTLAQAIGALSDAGVDIRTLFGWAPAGVVQLTVDNKRTAKKTLRESGIDFTETKAEIVTLKDEPGTLHAYLAKLAKKGVNLRSMASSNGETVVWTAKD